MKQRQCPDFVNTGHKVVVEVYCKQHKDKFRKGGCIGWKNDRTEVFTLHGWKVVFFDAVQVNEKYILEVLKEALEGG